MIHRQKRFYPAALVGLGLLLGAAGCNQRETAPAPDTTATVDTGGATVAEIVANPTAWHGRSVTVSGAVNRVVSPRSFVYDEGLLVLTAEPFADTVKVSDKDVVQVTGTVRNFVEKEIETDLGVDLEENTYVDYNNKPVLVARKTDITARQDGDTNVTVVQPQKTEKEVTVIDKDSPDRDVNVTNKEVNREVNKEVNVVRQDSDKKAGGKGNQTSRNQDKNKSKDKSRQQSSPGNDGASSGNSGDNATGEGSGGQNDSSGSNRGD